MDERDPIDIVIGPVDLESLVESINSPDIFDLRTIGSVVVQCLAEHQIDEFQAVKIYARSARVAYTAAKAMENKELKGELNGIGDRYTSYAVQLMAARL